MAFQHLRWWRGCAALLTAVLSVSLAACTTSVPPEVLESQRSMSQSLRPAPVPEPTLDQLQKLLNTALDPKIPFDKKKDTIEGGQDSPELFERMTKAKQESNATLTLSGQIIPLDRTTRTVAVKMAIPGQPPQNGEIKFVYDQKKWKVSKSYVCNTITLLMPDDVPATCMA